MVHKSVLLKEAIDGLEIEAGDIYLDATLGSGFHMEEVFKRTRGSVGLFGIDVDQMSIDIAAENLELSGAKPKLARLNFREIDKAAEIFGITPSKILFDLGWNSPQFDPPEGSPKRGFSFQKDEPLLMTFKSEAGEEDITAYEVVNDWEEGNLADIIYGYGEEKYARRIAKAIAEERKNGPIKSSLQLAEIIKKAVPVFYRFGRIHPATKTFQAIRIAVNDELRALEEGLKKAFAIMKPHGIMAVISFHSLEDRIVKNFIKEKVASEEGSFTDFGGKKPIAPSEEEVLRNPRSRSAKLRIIKKNR